MKNLTELPEWLALTDHHHTIAHQHMRDWFDKDLERSMRFSASFQDIFLDYSRNRLNESTLKLLFNLANAVELPRKIDDLFNGVPINTTENRPVLHTALRDPNLPDIIINGNNIADQITAMQEKMYSLVTQIHEHQWKGATGKPFEHIVNIGIGGSHTGPKLCTEALKDFAVTDMRFHFISSVDKTHLNEVLAEINPETTLFIISSKTFTTIETITNATTVLEWLQKHVGAAALKQHFIAITADTKKAAEFGIPAAHILPLWEWVGGRYSVWSAIGLPVVLKIGAKHFDEFLNGAYQMDQHFRTTPIEKNLPILLALIGIWNMNFLNTNVQAIVPYSHRLRALIPYLQQAEMESSGKRVNRSHQEVNYATGSVIFGEEGCDGQHTYHQLLHQGRHLIPVDFILLGKELQKDDHHQDILIASAISQAQALMRGKTLAEARAELIALNFSLQEAENLAQHRVIPGNKPSNILLLHRLTPKSLGLLIALYEHKIFVQGAIWDINSFDQWGVELGKQLLPNILQQVQGLQKGISTDPEIVHLIRHVKKIQDAL